jgi:hypothetical protein
MKAAAATTERAAKDSGLNRRRSWEPEFGLVLNLREHYVENLVLLTDTTDRCQHTQREREREARGGRERRGRLGLTEFTNSLKAAVLGGEE